MNQIDITKVLKLLGVLALIFILVGTASCYRRKNSITLDEYAKQHPENVHLAEGSEKKPEEPEKAGTSKNETVDGPETDGSLTASGDSLDADSDNTSQENPGENEASGSGVTGNATTGSGKPGNTAPAAVSTLTGALLNGGPDGTAMLDERITFQPEGMDTPADGFYSEPLSENLKRYITGISYPASGADQTSDADGADQTSGTGSSQLAITYDDLRYVHVLHFNFDGEPTEGELICNAALVKDFLEIFYELYCNEYQIEKMLLIDEYDADDTASITDNNTSCFNYRVVEGSTSLSKHALGRAIDINPYYNPYVTYNKDGSRNISPEGAEAYADRSADFPYKIDENDLCYKLFVSHGFIWGGNWNSVKDYQHFQKVPK